MLCVMCFRVFVIIPNIDADAGDILLQATNHFVKVILEQIVTVN